MLTLILTATYAIWLAVNLLTRVVNLILLNTLIKAYRSIDSQQCPSIIRWIISLFAFLKSVWTSLSCAFPMYRIRILATIEVQQKNSFAFVRHPLATGHFLRWCRKYKSCKSCIWAQCSANSLHIKMFQLAVLRCNSVYSCALGIVGG